MSWVMGILIVTSVAALAAGIWGGLAAVFARRRLETLQADHQARLAELEEHCRELEGQARQLNTRLVHLESLGARHGFKEAIALSQHGATASEIAESCGLNAGEAQLVRALHGTN